MLEIIKKLLFPMQRCLICGEKTERNALSRCSNCSSPDLWSKTGYHSCCLCAAFIPRGQVICAACWENEHRLMDRAKAPFLYETRIKKEIRNFKYHGKISLAKPLALNMFEVIKCDPGFSRLDLVVPVPLHADRLKGRGYNQSELLARVIAEQMGLPLAADILIRKINTPSQTNLNKWERQLNLAQAFVLKPNSDIFEKNILLVDDIYTTGATVRACCRVLKHGGAKRVCVVTCAAGKSQ